MTPKQQQVYQWLRGWFDENDTSPTYEQIGKGVGLRSRSRVHYRLRQLRDRGLITWQPTRTGTLRLVKNGDPVHDAAGGLLGRIVREDTDDGTVVVRAADIAALGQALADARDGARS